MSVKTSTRNLACILALLVASAALPFLAGDYWIGFGISLLMAIALTQSWSVLSSLSGYVSLGHVAFFGLGAYVTVVAWGSMPLWISICLSVVAACTFAAIVGLPILRVRGPYFVILSFGIAELLKYSILAIDSAHGKASRLILGTPELPSLFQMMLALAVVATLIAWTVRMTRLGHGLRAIRENEEAAETLGVPVARYKLLAFVLSAAVPGAVGAVMALRSTYFDVVQVFDPMLSFSMVAMAILGGSDDLKGPVAGAVFLTILSELLWSNAPQLYLIILGVLLIVFVLYIPGGIIGARRLGAARGEPAAQPVETPVVPAPDRALVRLDHELKA